MERAGAAEREQVAARHEYAQALRRPRPAPVLEPVARPRHLRVRSALPDPTPQLRQPGAVRRPVPAVPALHRQPLVHGFRPREEVAQLLRPQRVAHEQRAERGDTRLRVDHEARLGCRAVPRRLVRDPPVADERPETAEDPLVVVPQLHRELAAPRLRVHAEVTLAVDQAGHVVAERRVLVVVRVPRSGHEVNRVRGIRDDRVNRGVVELAHRLHAIAVDDPPVRHAVTSGGADSGHGMRSRPPSALRW